MPSRKYLNLSSFVFIALPLSIWAPWMPDNSVQIDPSNFGHQPQQVHAADRVPTFASPNSMQVFNSSPTPTPKVFARDALLRPASLTNMNCPLPEKPDRLVVTRIKNDLNNPSTASFARTVSDPSEVQKLCASVFALPTLTGMINCPMDNGISYAFDFYRKTTLLLHAIYNPTGCRLLQIRGEPIRFALTGYFNDELLSALQITPKQFFEGLP